MLFVSNIAPVAYVASAASARAVLYWIRNGLEASPAVNFILYIMSSGKWGSGTYLNPWQNSKT